MSLSLDSLGNDCKLSNGWNMIRNPTVKYLRESYWGPTCSRLSNRQIFIYVFSLSALINKIWIETSVLHPHYRDCFQLPLTHKLCQCLHLCYFNIRWRLYFRCGVFSDVFSDVCVCNVISNPCVMSCVTWMDSVHDVISNPCVTWMVCVIICVYDVRFVIHFLENIIELFCFS